MVEWIRIWCYVFESVSVVFAAGGFDLESQPLATPTALSARKLTKIETFSFLQTGSYF